MKKILRKKTVLEATSLSSVLLWRLQKENKFPKSFLLSKGGRAVGFYQEDIERWINDPSGWSKS